MVASLAILLWPFLPFSAEAFWAQLGLQGSPADFGWKSAGSLNVKPGQTIAEPSPMFRKVEEEDLKAAEALVR